MKFLSFIIAVGLAVWAWQQFQEETLAEAEGNRATASPGSSVPGEARSLEEAAEAVKPGERFTYKGKTYISTGLKCSEVRRPPQ